MLSCQTNLNELFEKKIVSHFESDYDPNKLPNYSCESFDIDAYATQALYSSNVNLIKMISNVTEASCFIQASNTAKAKAKSKEAKVKEGTIDACECVTAFED